MTADTNAAKVRRREIFGYCMFDFANSSFTTLISTVAYSFYFRQAVVGPGDTRADLLWGIAAARTGSRGPPAIRVQRSPQRSLRRSTSKKSRPATRIRRTGWG